MAVKTTIYTQSVDSTSLIVKKYFDAFTLVVCGGVFNGEPEKCMIFTIIHQDNLETRNKIACLAEEIKLRNSQKQVLVTTEFIETKSY